MSAIALPAARVRRLTWEQGALFGVLALAAVLCLWDLTISGYSNEYYAAAARAGSESWKAWFFGAIDPGSFITVDKPPLSLWLMGLSARVLGFSSFAILLPQALCTVAAVGTLFATVRRVAGPVAGLVAAAAMALTPITIAVARVNNPDALLVLLLVLSAYLTVRAIESGRGKWLYWAGAVVGLAFMTKMLQGWMVVPALGLAYLVAAPPRLLVRIRQLVVAFAVMVAVSCAWPLAVTLWPGSKPFIGGSDDGGVWNLILGYNGFGRIFGEGGGMGGGGGPTFGGAAGLWRMFNAQVGGQIAWLLPVAAVSLLSGLWLTRRAPRTDLRRAGLILFGTWALVHVAVFSSQQGIFHPYYVSALAPAVAALVGMWRGPRWLAALCVAGTAVLAVELLGRTPDFAPWLGTVIPVAAAVAVVALLLPGRKTLAVGAAAAAIAIGAAPAAYTVDNLGHALNGNNVLAGPASSQGGGPGGGGGFRGGNGGPPSGGFGGGTPPSGATAGGTTAGGATSGGGTAAGGATGGPPSGGGGFGGGSQVSDDMLAYLQKNQGSAKFLVAVSGSQASAPIIIQTGEAVVTMGGFSGSDNAPTVSQLESMVSKGELKYVLLGGRGGSSDVSSWVQAHGTAVDGYDGLYKVTL